MAKTAKLKGLRIYPVKGLDGMDVDAWELDAFGLRLDRRWMVVDPSGRCITRSEQPGLATVRAEIEGDRVLLTSPNQPSVDLPIEPEPGPTEPATIGNDTISVRDVSGDANRWLSQELRTACRIVFLEESWFRTVDPALGARKAKLAFQDELPLQIMTIASLADLDGRVDGRVSIPALAPNLLIDDGGEPYDDDTWRSIRIGDLEIDIVKPWAHDAIVGATGDAPGPEVVALLAGFRSVDGRPSFGQLGIPATTTGVLRVGAVVEVLERGDAPSFGAGDAEPEEIVVPEKAEAGAPEEEEAEAGAPEEEEAEAEEVEVAEEAEAVEDVEAEAEEEDASEGDKKVRIITLPFRRKSKTPPPIELDDDEPEPWATPAAEEPEAGPEEEAEAEEPEPEEPEPEEVAEAAPEPEPEPADEELVAIEVTADRVPDLAETLRLVAAAAVSESAAEAKALAEACLRATVLVTAWQGKTLVGLLRGWTDEVRDGFIADVAVHPDHLASGAAADLVRAAVDRHPDVRWVLRASPGSAYLGSALGWRHVGSGWYLSPR